MKEKKKKTEKAQPAKQAAAVPAPVNPAGKIANYVMLSGLVLLFGGYFAIYLGSDTLAPAMIVLGLVTFGISLLLEPDWLPR